MSLLEQFAAKYHLSVQTCKNGEQRIDGVNGSKCSLWEAQEDDDLGSWKRGDLLLDTGFCADPEFGTTFERVTSDEQTLAALGLEEKKGK